MKYMLFLFLLTFSFVTFADARLELDTGTVHAPWSQANADLEYKSTDGAKSIVSLQHADGTYTAQYEGTWPEVNQGLIDADLSGMDSEGTVTTTTNCTATAGTFQDDNGNAFTTNDCVVRLTYRRTQRSYRYDIDAYVLLRRASAAAAAAAVTLMNVGGDPGASVAYR